MDKQSANATGSPPLDTTGAAQPPPRKSPFRGLEALRRRHAAYFLKIMERVAPRLWDTDQAVWLDYLEREHGNLRAVFTPICCCNIS